MSREFICSVLDVPPDPWPPDHYTLVGVTPERADSTTVEAEVQKLTARLRPYQLAYPDDVTEALNRLAQALVCLTDPAARAAYDAARRQSAANDPIALAPMPPPPALVHAPRLAETLGEASRALRRADYRRIVATRRLRDSWRALRAWLDYPARAVTDLSDAAELICALWAVRDSSDRADVPEAFRQGRSRVVALAHLPNLLREFRRMTLEQRAALAEDWRTGDRALQLAVLDVRNRVKRPARWPRALVRLRQRLRGRGVDIALLLVGGLALALSIWAAVAR